MLSYTIPLARLQDPDNGIKAGALAGAVLQAVVPDAFFWLFLILVASNLADWIFGRQAACAPGGEGFDRKKSRHGLLSKAAQITVLLLLRSLEVIFPLTGLPSTMGIASSALCLALIVEDLESLERHSITLGGKGIPGLSPILTQIRKVSMGDRRHPDHPVPPPDTGQRRREGDPPNGEQDA